MRFRSDAWVTILALDLRKNRSKEVLQKAGQAAEEETMDALNCLTELDFAKNRQQVSTRP